MKCQFSALAVGADKIKRKKNSFQSAFDLENIFLDRGEDTSSESSEDIRGSRIFVRASKRLALRVARVKIEQAINQALVFRQPLVSRNSLEFVRSVAARLHFDPALQPPIWEANIGTNSLSRIFEHFLYRSVLTD